ncbi:MAG: hypothetical protein AAFR31_02565 [Cyanobacteria bacterium J06627_8]
MKNDSTANLDNSNEPFDKLSRGLPDPEIEQGALFYINFKPKTPYLNILVEGVSITIN